MRITVIGSGNGAFATAADLSHHEITLYSDRRYEKNLAGVVGSKIIKYTGVEKGVAYLREVTCSIARAMKNPDLIIVSTPATTHENVAREIAPYVRDGSRILLSPGSMCGSLVFARVFREMGINKKVIFMEFHTLPYTARKISDDTIDISLYTKFLYFSAFPAKYNEEMYEFIKPLYPNAILANDILEVGLNNGNATSHPAAMVLNAGKIEYYGKHAHYREGITPAVANVIQGIDDERQLLCRAYGYKPLDIKDRLYRMGYAPKKDTVYEAFQSSEVFMPLDGPNDLNARYLVEDVPYALVPMVEFASLARLKDQTALMSSVTNLACSLKSENYWKTGRTLKSMGLSGKMSVREVKELLQTGDFECRWL